MRTTIDIDDSVLDKIKRLQRCTGQSLGRLVSDLLARSLADVQHHDMARPAFRWTSAAMGARFDLSDTDAMTRIEPRQ
jgi:hypothetical protein